MTKEELVKLGLTEEQISEVFKINGQDIETLKREKSAFDNEKLVWSAEKENFETKLNAANEKIQEFSKLDIEQIKKESSEYKQKFEESQINHNEEMKNLQLNHSIDMGLQNAKVKNLKAVKALLDMDLISKSEDVNKILDEQLITLKESDSYLFEDVGGTSSITGGGNPEKPKDNMTYSEMMSYLEKNPGANL